MKNIGVLFDSDMRMRSQISSVCKTCWYYMRRLWKIRHLLSIEQAKILVHAFVISRLDANNSLLYGLTDTAIKPMQRVQNAAAKLVFGARKFDHVRPLMRQLHWLPVRQRISFKVLSLAFKCLHGSGPSYLSELVSYYRPVRALRSNSDGHLLNVPKTKMKTCGDRSFGVAASQLWNLLPRSIREMDSLAGFKRSIKTELFRECYGET